MRDSTLCVVEIQGQHSQTGEHEDSVGEHEPVAEVSELAWEEAVAREHRREAWEALERGVRGEDEDGERRHLDDPEHEPECRSRSGGTG